MKPYEYDANGRSLCVNHHLLRCSESEYTYDLEQQNKRYREFIENVSDNWLIAEKIKNEVEGIRIITPHHLLNWINKEANKLLEE